MTRRVAARDRLVDLGLNYKPTCSGRSSVKRNMKKSPEKAKASNHVINDWQKKAAAACS